VTGNQYGSARLTESRLKMGQEIAECVNMWRSFVAGGSAWLWPGPARLAPIRGGALVVCRQASFDLNHIVAGRDIVPEQFEADVTGRNAQRMFAC
jgi:hypothetical protein